MTRANLKAAMDALQVKKPLRLYARAPSFTAPLGDPAETLVGNPAQVGNQTWVENQTQVLNPTLVEKETPITNPTPVGNANEVENSTQVGNATMEKKTTQVEFRTQVPNPTLVEIPTPVSKATLVQKTTMVENSTQVPYEPVDPVRDSALLIRRATEQDSSVTMVARAADGLGRGYTRIPNEVLLKLASGDFTRNEIKLALLIARFTISFQRRLAPLSKAVLERQSGLRGPAVLEALSGLVAKGMVEKQQGDQHRPNQLGLILPDDWESIKPKRESERTLVENPTQVEKETQVPNLTASPVEKATPAGVGNPTCFKDIKKYKNSLSEFPEPLQKYFLNLKPAMKRESEWKAFEGILGDYPAEDISDCLVLLQEKGIKGGPNSESFKPCHSPMAYLARAIGDILCEVETRRRGARERVEREKREAEAVRERAENEALESTAWARKERAFLEAFPSEEAQRAALSGLLQGSHFSAASRPGWILGIGKWWDSETEGGQSF